MNSWISTLEGCTNADEWIDRGRDGWMDTINSTHWTITLTELNGARQRRCFKRNLRVHEIRGIKME